MTKPAFFLPSLDETARLSLLPGAAEVAVRTALRRPAAVAVPAGTVSDVLVDRATRHPDRPAVIEKSGVVTYRELLERVAELRSLLLGWGCRHGERVAVTGPRGSERIALVLALESLGAVYVPLEADWPANRALEILNQIRAAFLLVHAAGRDSTHQDPDDPLPAVAARRAGIPVRHVPTASPEDTPCTAWPVRRPEAAEPRYVIHTSGSSGRPKGVVVEHRGLMNHLWDKVRGLELGPDDVIAFSAPTSYVISVWQILAPILVGARVAVVDEDDVRYPKPLMAAVRRTEVSILEVVPAVLEWMVKLGQRSPEDPLLPRLRCLISTGAELRPQLAAEALSAFPGVTLVNAYGASECSDDVAEHVVTAADVNKPRMPVGRPIANAVLYLLVHDGGAWRAAGPGEEGELWVGGLPVGAGYAYDAERTRRSFVADELDPDSGTGRLYRTGDLARFEDGVAYCLGRADRQVKISGMRVELDDIEITLMRHPEIEHCAVVAAGDGDDRYVAACFSSRREIPHGELREFALRYLPSGMIPRRWVQLDAFPRLDRGKTDYRAIAESLS